MLILLSHLERLLKTLRNILELGVNFDLDDHSHFLPHPFFYYLGAIENCGILVIYIEI